MSFFSALRERFTALLGPADGGDSPAVTTAEGPAGALLERLKTVVDPELDLDIVNLGLVREVVVAGPRARVVMTFTTEGCPAAPQLYEEVTRVVDAAGLLPEVEVEFDPPWSPEHISAEGRRYLDEAW